MREKESPVFRWALLITKHKSRPKLNKFENSSKVDVYDYAAQFDRLPTFEYFEIPKSRNHTHLIGSSAHVCRVTVEGTSIVGEALSSVSRAYAELQACMVFKQEAEKFHLGGQILVKDINKLTSATGEKFLQYCKIQQKDWEPYNFLTKTGPANSQIGSLFQGTRLLSECTMYTYVTRLNFSKR
jgi:hypothetical protein